MAQLAYYAGMQPSEVGKLNPPDAQELLRRVHKLRQEDQQVASEHTKAIVEGLVMVAKQQANTAQLIAKAFGAMR